MACPCLEDQVRRLIGRKCSKLGQMQTAIKHEPNPSSARAGGIPGDTATDPTSFPSWGIPPSYPDAYQQLSNKILDFLCPPTVPSNPTTTQFLNYSFQPSFVRNYLDNYAHYHAHFSFLHAPTFRALEAHVGLLAGMCCIGACYSGRIPSGRIREVMDVFRSSLERSSHMFASLSRGERSGIQYDWTSFRTNKSALEELQAICLAQVLLTWHGTPAQREWARRIWHLVAGFARKAGLLALAADASLRSPLHQPGLENHPVEQFDWLRWVDQEGRIRTMYLIFVYDAALGLYFNCGPEFDPFEIRLPLPADDAAWEASNPTECAEALGLYGAHSAAIRNPDGTKRSNQPEMRLVLKALLDTSYQVQPGSTNLYGKFILIHALLDIMRRVQLEGSAAVLRSNTPVPAHAWFVGAQGSPSSNNSGRATPVDIGTNLLDPQTAKTLLTALDKFKANWDNDMAVQFPPSTVARSGRYGFSRDGIHFYWLAKYLLKSTRPTDLQMAPDQRFAHVIHMLKSVKSWVMTDNASRGEDMGSVAEIDDAYGVQDATLDMTQLFRHLPTGSKSPGIATAQGAAGRITQ